MAVGRQRGGQSLATDPAGCQAIGTVPWQKARQGKPGKASAGLRFWPVSRVTASHLGRRAKQERVLSTLTEWLADPSCSGNPTTLLVAGLIYAGEEDYVEALKACHLGLTLEM